MKASFLLLSLALRICWAFLYPDDHYYYDNLALTSFEETPHYHNQPRATVEVIDYSAGCPQTHEPICATNGQEYLYFKNACELEVRNYEELIQGRLEYTKCSLQRCQPHKPPCVTCPDFEEPICAIDLNTQQLVEFKNLCEMDYAACSLERSYRYQFHGSCAQRLQCPSVCPLLYQPICARSKYETREFPNRCELEKSQCESNIKWKILNSGSCPRVNNNFNYNRPQPVCAAYRGKKKTFVSYSQMERETLVTGQTWILLHQGRCEAHTSCSSSTFRPVCAMLKLNVTTFYSPCHLQKENERLGKVWSILHFGLCDSVTELNKDSTENPNPTISSSTTKETTYEAPTHTTTPSDHEETIVCGIETTTSSGMLEEDEISTTGTINTSSSENTSDGDGIEWEIEDGSTTTSGLEEEKYSENYVTTTSASFDEYGSGSGSPTTPEIIPENSEKYPSDINNCSPKGCSSDPSEAKSTNYYVSSSPADNYSDTNKSTGYAAGNDNSETSYTNSPKKFVENEYVAPEINDKISGSSGKDQDSGSYVKHYSIRPSIQPEEIYSSTTEGIKYEGNENGEVLEGGPKTAPSCEDEGQTSGISYVSDKYEEDDYGQLSTTTAAASNDERVYSQHSFSLEDSKLQGYLPRDGSDVGIFKCDHTGCTKIEGYSGDSQAQESQPIESRQVSRNNDRNSRNSPYATYSPSSSNYVSPYQKPTSGETHINQAYAGNIDNDIGKIEGSGLNSAESTELPVTNGSYETTLQTPSSGSPSFSGTQNYIKINNHSVHLPNQAPSSPLVYNKSDSKSSNTKNISHKKEEIYNGAVYTAPVYDAPTYNFITIPHHFLSPSALPYGFLPFGLGHLPFSPYTKASPTSKPAQTEQSKVIADTQRTITPLGSTSKSELALPAYATKPKPYNPLTYGLEKNSLHYNTTLAGLFLDSLQRNSSNNVENSYKKAAKDVLLPTSDTSVQLSPSLLKTNNGLILTNSAFVNKILDNIKKIENQVKKYEKDKKIDSY